MQTPYMASSVVLATNADGVEFTSLQIKYLIMGNVENNRNITHNVMFKHICCCELAGAVPTPVMVLVI